MARQDIRTHLWPVIKGLPGAGVARLLGAFQDRCFASAGEEGMSCQLCSEARSRLPLLKPCVPILRDDILRRIAKLR